MNYSLKATGIKLTDAIKLAVDRKIVALTPKMRRYGDAISCSIEVGKTTRHHKKGDVYRAEFYMAVPGAKMYASSLHEDLYAAINEAAREISRQVMVDKDSKLSQKKGHHGA